MLLSNQVCFFLHTGGGLSFSGSGLFYYRFSGWGRFLDGGRFFYNRFHVGDSSPIVFGVGDPPRTHCQSPARFALFSQQLCLAPRVTIILLVTYDGVKYIHM